jgi:hypothetical protein
MTYHRVCNKSNTTGATCGVGTASPFLSTWVDTLSDFWWRSRCSTFGFLCGVLYIIVPSIRTESRDRPNTNLEVVTFEQCVIEGMVVLLCLTPLSTIFSYIVVVGVGTASPFLST